MSKVYTNKRPRAIRKKRTVKPSIKNYIKAEISRNTENKSIQVYRPNVDILAFNSANNINNTIFPLSPFSGFAQIDQGTSASGRIGNSIKIKRCMFKGILFPLAYSAGTNGSPREHEVRMFIFYDRETPTDLPVVGSEFLQLGGSSQSLQSTLIDMISPVNSDRYRLLHSKTFKVGRAAYNGSGADPDRNNNHNNDFKLNCKFSIDVTKYLVNNVKFNDGLANPTTRGTYVLFESVHADGTASATSLVAVNLSYTLDLQYEDA